MPNRYHYFAAAVLGLGLVFASCNKGPISPPPPQPGPPQPVPLTTVRLELVAPAEIAPGEAVQLTANAIKADGSVENVSNRARWIANTPGLLTVNSTGVALGRGRGESQVSATFDNRSAGAKILVLPKGTFRLTGTVRESGFGIANVTLTVISGVGEGLTTVSGSGGLYVFYGVSGPVQIQSKKHGYLNGTQRLDVTAHRTYDFDIASERPRNDYRGTYTLTISAPSCPLTKGTFPDAARRRVYTANVTQEGARLTVKLSNADLIVSNGRGNSFVGFVDTTETISFLISDSDSYYYNLVDFDIAERFSGTALLVVGGASVRGTAALLTGTLGGGILISSSASPPFYPYSSYCYSENHAFEMVRH